MTPYEKYCRYIRYHAALKGAPQARPSVTQECFDRVPELVEYWTNQNLKPPEIKVKTH